MRNLEKRRSKRYSQSFASIEERDRFLVERFPRLDTHGRPGFFQSPTGTKVRVWYNRVIWQEPVSEASEVE